MEWSRKLPQKVPEREWREGESGVKLKQKMVGNFSPPCRWQSLSLEDGEARGARKPAKFHPSSLLLSDIRGSVLLLYSYETQQYMNRLMTRPVEK